MKTRQAERLVALAQETRGHVGPNPSGLMAEAAAASDAVLEAWQSTGGLKAEHATELQSAIGASGLRALCGEGYKKRIRAAFDESKVSRDAGRFSSKPGAGAAPEDAPPASPEPEEGTPADAGPADPDAAMPPGKTSGRRMQDGTVAIDHEAYQEWIATQPDEVLAYIIGDASDALRANPTSHKSGYYADEINYCAMEIKRRSGGGAAQASAAGPATTEHVYRGKRKK